MNKEELIEVLRQFDEKRVEELPEKTRNIFYAIMEIADERDRLNNIINRIDNFVDRTIEVIKQQPSDNDEWILERLNGIKYLTELKENN